MKLFLLLTLSALIANGAVAAGVDPSGNSVTLSLTSEPPNLDSSLSEDTTSGFVLGLIKEGLVRIDSRGQVIPGVAERWETRALSATFWLRKDAKWSDGSAVTAHDFEYALKRLVDPETAASGSTFFTYVFENASEILAGQLPRDALGVKAIDNFTLEIRLSRPTPYILTVLAGTAYMPISQRFEDAQQDRYGADAEHLLSNGPFKLDRWVHNASMVMSRNDHYWDRDNVKLDAFNIGYITADTRSLFNLFKSGELAALRLDENILKDASRESFRVRKAPTNCLAWLIMNMREDRPTSNLTLRQAIRLAFDRDRYANNIVGLPGIRKIDSVFTRRIRGVSGSFQSEHPAPEIEFNITKARQHIDQARQELGGEIPPLILLANEYRQIEAEFIQSQLQSALGLDIRVDKQTFKQSIAKMNAGDFDIARAGFCGGALLDPVFFAGIFDSASPYNNGAYQNARYDELMQITHGTADQQVRMGAFAEMQQRLYQDIPIIPTHESAWIYLQDDRVSGFIRYPAVNFSRGFIDI